MRYFPNRTRRSHGLGLVTVLVALMAGPAWATVPGQIDFQGLLLDDLGDPVTGSVSMAFSLFDADTGGTALWTESHPGVNVLDGVYQVPLGSVTPIDPSVLAGPAVYLEVAVDGDTLSPRQRLLAVPYALRADEADNLSGLSGEVLTQIYANVNFDGGLPSDDPSEGLQDTDGDGVANFVDADNDGDGLSDDEELAQGSDTNVVTPIITGYSPTTADGWTTTPVTVLGQNFSPGLSVTFGSETPAPYAISAGQFTVDVGPQPAGTVNVDVVLANAETDSSAFDFFYFDPVVESVSPQVVYQGPPVQLTITGQNFIPGLTVQIGSQTPTATNVTATSFEAVVTPTPGSDVADVTVTLPNGRSGVLPGGVQFVGNQRVIFVTAETSNGDLGGIAGADATCNQAAQAASLPGTFQAWLADSSVSPSTRSTQFGPYLRTDGATVADNWTDLTDGTIAAPINRDQHGVLVTDQGKVWTNVDAFTAAQAGSKHCADWTSSTNGVLGTRGDANETDDDWSVRLDSDCSNADHHLYCIEQ